MNILYISKSIIPSRSANSIHVMKMCQAFADNGHKVVLLAPDIKDKYEKGVENVYDYYGVKKNFKIRKLFHPNLRAGAFLYIISIFFYLMINLRFDLVYGRFLHGIYVATIFNYKVIYEAHLPASNKNDHRLIVFKKLIKSENFLKMVVISQALKKIYLNKGYLNAEKIQVAHDGADTVENLDSKIELLGKKHDLKVGYVGHLYKGRGIEIIIECAKRLNYINFYLVGGLKEDIEYWESYTKNLNLNNIFFYGFVTPKETIKYRNSFDILLAPYAKKVSILGDHNGDTSKFMSPLKIFEYMSHKKPIIVSDLPVIREVLNEKNSILVECDDIELWINSIKKLEDPKNRELIANQALSDFYNYSWKNRALLAIKL